MSASSEATDERRATLAYAAALAVMCAFCVSWIHARTESLASGKDRYLVEDAGISVVFAKYIASGEGAVYYPDGERVEGYSNPLWTFAIAVFAKMGVDPFDVPRPLGLASSGVAMFFAGMLFFWTVGGRLRFAGLAIPPFIAGAGTVVIWSIAGLENGLFAATLVGAVALFARERANPDARPFSGVLFFLAAITRPEGVAYGGLAGLFVIATEIVPRRKIERRHIVFALSFLAPYVVYQAIRYAYFAWPLPNTFYGKTSDANLDDLTNLKTHGWNYLLDYIDAYGYAMVFALAAIAPVCRRFGRGALFAFGALLFACFFPVYARGDWMEEWRFCSTVTFLLVPLAAIGAARLGSLANRVGPPLDDEPPSRRWRRLIAAFAVTLGVFGVVLFPQFPATRKHLNKFLQKPIVNTYKLQTRGAYFREMADAIDLVPGSILDVDMGGIGAASGMVIYDVGKLCDVPFGINQWDETFVDDYVFTETRPDFLHAREGFGRGSHITTHPRLLKDWILLPQDRRLGWERPNGNFVRKALVLAPPDEATFDPLPVGGGVAIVNASAYPNPVRARDTVRFRIVWQAMQKPAGDIAVEYALVDPEGATRASQKRHLAQDWYLTSEWHPGEKVVDLVKMRVPKSVPEGVWSLAVRVLDEDEAGKPPLKRPEHRRIIAPEPDWNGVPTTTQPNFDSNNADPDQSSIFNRQSSISDVPGASFAVSKDETATAIAEHIASIAEQTRRDPFVARETLRLLDTYRLRRAERGRVAEAKKVFVDGVAKAARAYLDAGDETRAADLVVLARRVNHRDAVVIGVARDLSRLSYKRGRAAQKADRLDEAYAEYREALRRSPQNAWARRHAEETRPAGVLRRGKRDLPFVAP